MSSGVATPGTGHAPTPPGPSCVAEVLDRLEQAAEGAERVSVQDLARAIGERSYGPFILLPAVLDISPVGTAPGAPTVLAAILVVFAAQRAVGRHHLWLPRLIASRTVGAQRLHKTVGLIRPVGDRMDRWFHGRLPALFQEPVVRAAAITCVVLALLMPPLEIIPFATTLASAPIALFGLAFVFRDGVLMLAAFAAAAGAMGGALWLAAGYLGSG